MWGKISRNSTERHTPGVFLEALAAVWKAEKVFPLVGALMAPTIPG